MMEYRVKVISLLNIEKPQRKKFRWLKVMTPMQYRARYRSGYYHYLRLCEKVKARKYQAFARFKVL